MSDFHVTVPLGFTWSFPATVQRWKDGDTPVLYVRRTADEELDGVEVRIDGINAIEIKAQFGAEAKAYAEQLAPVGSAVMLVERNKREKYGRELSRILLPDGRDFGTEMLLAKASDGATPLAVPYSP
jgi:endonuclease YncB( thermonuclease family)